MKIKTLKRSLCLGSLLAVLFSGLGRADAGSSWLEIDVILRHPLVWDTANRFSDLGVSGVFWRNGQYVVYAGNDCPFPVKVSHSPTPEVIEVGLPECLPSGVSAGNHSEKQRQAFEAILKSPEVGDRVNSAPPGEVWIQKKGDSCRIGAGSCVLNLSVSNLADLKVEVTDWSCP